ncbi:MAG: hypothetical protein ABIJ19_02810, partial [Patescibacteria group bacterium]
MRQKKVVIVREGGWGSVKQEQYNETAEGVKRSLERLARPNSSKPREEEKVFASVEIVSTLEEARKKDLNNFDIMIFLTRGQIKEARAIKKERPKI